MSLSSWLEFWSEQGGDIFPMVTNAPPLEKKNKKNAPPLEKNNNKNAPPSRKKNASPLEKKIIIKMLPLFKKKMFPSREKIFTHPESVDHTIAFVRNLTQVLNIGRQQCKPFEVKCNSMIINDY